MRIEENVQTVKDFFAAMGGNRQNLLALVAEDFEWMPVLRMRRRGGIERVTAARQHRNRAADYSRSQANPWLPGCSGLNPVSSQARGHC